MDFYDIFRFRSKDLDIKEGSNGDGKAEEVIPIDEIERRGYTRQPEARQPETVSSLLYVLKVVTWLFTIVACGALAYAIFSGDGKLIAAVLTAVTIIMRAVLYYIDKRTPARRKSR